MAARCYSTIRLLSRIKYFLTSEQLQLLVCSLVLSTLDYCNILYYGISASNLRKLQSIQNSAARLALKVNYFDTIKTDDLFTRLHWLKIRERISYKILITVHKCIYGNAPSDLKDMIKLSKSNRTKKLVMKRFNGNMGKRAFSVCGPRLWNSLPINLRMDENIDKFKKCLKTFLFKNANLFHEQVNIL